MGIYLRYALYLFRSRFLLCETVQNSWFSSVFSMPCIHSLFQMRSEVKFRSCYSLRLQSASVQGLIKNPDKVSLLFQVKPTVSSWGSGNPIEVLPIGPIGRVSRAEDRLHHWVCNSQQSFLAGICLSPVTPTCPEIVRIFSEGKKTSYKTISSNTTFLCTGIGRDLLYVK